MRNFGHEDSWKQPWLDRALEALIAQQGIQRAEKVNELILAFNLWESDENPSESTKNLQS